MNELYIKDMWAYFKTDADNYEDALDEFYEACSKVGIEIGCVYEGVLQDENGDELPYMYGTINATGENVLMRVRSNRHDYNKK